MMQKGSVDRGGQPNPKVLKSEHRGWGVTKGPEQYNSYTAVMWVMVSYLNLYYTVYILVLS